MLEDRFDVPYVESDTGAAAGYGVAPYFDFDTGDIVLDGSGRVKLADARQAWLMWCVKSVLTEKNACMAYSDNIGTGMNWALEQSTRTAQQEALVNAITDALMGDPGGRTLSVSGFSFEWSADSVQISFSLLGADGYRGEVSASVDT